MSNIIYKYISQAVYANDLDQVKLMHEANYPIDNQHSYSNLYFYSCKNGNLNMLKFLHENGYPYEKETTKYAVQYCQYDCLVYAYENGFPLSKEIPSLHSYYMLNCLNCYGIDDNEFALRLEKKDDFLKCYKYCYQRWTDPIEFWNLSTYLNLESFDYDEEEGVTKRVMDRCFTDIIDLDDPFWYSLFSQDINLRNIPTLLPISNDDSREIMLKLERQQALNEFQDKIDLKKKIIAGEIIVSQTQYFESKYKEYNPKYRNKNVHLQDEQFQGLDKAAFYGDLEAIKYLYQINYFLCWRSTYAASKRGHLNCLKYLHENGCKIDFYSAISACKNGHIETFKYCFQVWEDPQDFWKERKFQTIDLSKIIDQIDLDDPVWRKCLSLNLDKYPILQKKVEDKKIDLEIRKQTLYTILHQTCLSTDIIQHIILSFV